MRVVANAGPLIHLSWIDQLDLLPTLFGAVLVPLAVQDEVLRASPDVLGMAALRAAFAADWLTVQAVTDRSAVTRLRARARSLATGRTTIVAGLPPDRCRGGRGEEGWRGPLWPPAFSELLRRADQRERGRPQGPLPHVTASPAPTRFPPTRPTRRGRTVDLDLGESEAIMLMREASAVLPLLEDLRRLGFRISAELMEQVRREEIVP